MAETTQTPAASTNGASTTGKHAPNAAKPSANGLHVERRFSKAGVSPYDEVQWERRTAAITDMSGKVIFEQKDVEMPVDWSMTATNIVASKYLHGHVGTPQGEPGARETGVRQLVARVAESIRDWGVKAGYFATPEDAAVFHDDLAHLLLNQKVAFNSPVWFNVGCDRLEPDSDAQNWHWNPETRQVAYSATGYRNPQCSACFINSVDDSLDSILTLAKTEGMLFKWGSGTGTNLSPIRGSMEHLSGGGTASGPLSFMRGFDAFAGVIKSGGKTRRAAKMVVLNVDHPDVEDFIECKAKEEQKAFALIQAGYDGSGPDSEAYSSIFFQNANNSVRVNDEFMHAWERNADFALRSVKDGAPIKTLKARDLMAKIAEATWVCGDPGMQYDTTVNRWHTSKNSGRINASNPCSEYMFLDNSACNLASFNLMKFVTPAGTFDIAAYRAAVDILIIAMDILVDSAGYPTELISRNSHDYRPLGLGYANLGALLMNFGLPYDSDAGRDFAATLTAIMCGEAYLQSACLAESCPPLAAATALNNGSETKGGACPGFYSNREPFLDVIRMHRAEANHIGKSRTSAEPFQVPQLDALIAASKDCWDTALAHGEKHGYRNSQVTVLAPTGTIGFMMDCDTTGIEPDLALVKYKKLVGGGMIKIVNGTVPGALFKLGYTDAEVQAIVSYIDATGTIEGAPAVRPEHLAVFDCSFKPAKGTRSIHYLGHLKMMAATQPFLSGAISKTVNLPHDCSVADIAETYVEAWRLGIKAVAIYRDGSKGVQPLNVSQDEKKSDGTLNAAADRILAALSAGITAPTADLKTLEAKLSDRLEVSARSIAAAAEAFEATLHNAVIATEAQTLNSTVIPSEGQTSNSTVIPSERSEPRDLLFVGSATNPGDVTNSSATVAGWPQASASPSAQEPAGPPKAVRHRLPEERASLTHKFSIAGHEGYITVGLYPNGQPGEIFIKMAKEGSTVSGLVDSFATATSLSLQHGVPLKVLVEKFAHTRFEPSGWTGNEQIGFAKSIMDYIFRWLQLRFLSGTQLSLFAGMTPQTTPPQTSIPVLGTIQDTTRQDTTRPDTARTDTSRTLRGVDPVTGAVDSAPISSSHYTPSYPTSAISPSVIPIDRPQIPGILPKLDATNPPDPSAANHISEAMRAMYDMGDAPSCQTCGAIMVRNGSCYRCMSCGSTSGCS